MPLLDSYSEDVTALGACNTVVFRDGKSRGHNTDWIGFAENFRRGLPGASVRNVVQLGAGGAGSAIAYALLKLGAARIVVHEIEPGTRRSLRAAFQSSWPARTRLRLRGAGADVAAADGVINCTPWA